MKYFFSFILIFISFASCKKTTQTPDNGTYPGTFKVIYSSATYSGPVSITFNNATYQCSGNSNRYPAGGSGSFSAGTAKITFKDINFWTADFDGNLILDGEYDYSYDGNHLKIWASKNNVGYYEYDLRKE